MNKKTRLKGIIEKCVSCNLKEQKSKKYEEQAQNT